MLGVASLKEVSSTIIFNSYTHKANPENEVSITAGDTEAVFAAISEIVNAGDEVIAFDPSYDCYHPTIRINGGISIHINLLPPKFKVDWGFVEQKITSRTGVIRINTPPE